MNKEDLDKIKLRPELVSITSVNPLCNHNSASRSLMLSAHLSQSLTLDNGDEKILQSGTERELSMQTFSKDLKNDSRVISIVPRYRGGVEFNSVNHTVDAVMIYEDLSTNEICHINLPYSTDLHTYFGFKYDWNHDVLDNLDPNDILEAGTVLASSPAVTKNNGYKFGVNLNVVMMTINETAEDGIVLSESAAKRMSMSIFEKRTVEFGTDSFMLNVYGDEGHYKPFPEIGEHIHKTGALVALRDYDDKLSPALMSKRSVCEFDPMFDKVTYVRDGSGVVVDIKALHSSKPKKEMYSNTDELVSKYVSANIRYHQELIDVHNNIIIEHRQRYQNSEPNFSPDFTRLIVNAMAIVDSDKGTGDKKLKKLFRKEPMDMYRMEFTIQYDLVPGLGYKISDLSGGKSIICEVRKDEDMPIDKDGVRADLIADPAGTISRMNIARFYEGYIAKASRTVKRIITNELIALDEIDDLDSTINDLDKDMVIHQFGTLIKFLKIMGTEQYEAYKAVTKLDVMREVLKEVVDEDFYLYYALGSKPAYEIVAELEKSPYAPTIDTVKFRTPEGIIETKEKIIIAPMYIILLAKIADTWLSTSSAKVNHFGLPTSTTKAEKHRLPWRNSATKTLSETESRLYASYVGTEFLAELKDRGSSITAHENMYMNILTADNPSNIDRVVDRTVVPYGQDKALEMVNSIFNAAGIGIKYTSDEVQMH